MGELIERIEQKKIGIKAGDKVVKIMAFANDFVLIVENPGDMKMLLQNCARFFNEKGLSINGRKCASLKVLSIKGKKAMKVITKVHQYWKGQPIPNINFEKLGRDLRLYINHEGRVKLPRNLWKVCLERIRKSCLTVFQKIQFFKEVICNKILFQLRLSNHGLEEAKRLDWIIRAKAKEILQLRSMSFTDWIHSKEHLGLIELQSNPLVARKKTSEKMLLSDDTVATVVTNSSSRSRSNKQRTIGGFMVA